MSTAFFFDYRPVPLGHFLGSNVEGMEGSSGGPAGHYHMTGAGGGRQDAGGPKGSKGGELCKGKGSGKAEREMQFSFAGLKCKGIPLTLRFAQ